MEKNKVKKVEDFGDYILIDGLKLKIKEDDSNDELYFEYKGVKIILSDDTVEDQFETHFNEKVEYFIHSFKCMN